MRLGRLTAKPTSVSGAFPTAQSHPGEAAEIAPTEPTGERRTASGPRSGRDPHALLLRHETRKYGFGLGGFQEERYAHDTATYMPL